MLSEDFFRRRLEVALADYLKGYSVMGMVHVGIATHSFRSSAARFRTRWNCQKIGEVPNQEWEAVGSKSSVIEERKLPKHLSHRAQQIFDGRRDELSKLLELWIFGSAAHFRRSRDFRPSR